LLRKSIAKKKNPRPEGLGFFSGSLELLGDLGDGTGTNSAATLTDREA
jgi:hypothetical protein